MIIGDIVNFCDLNKTSFLDGCGTGESFVN